MPNDRQLVKANKLSRQLLKKKKINAKNIIQNEESMHTKKKSSRDKINFSVNHLISARMKQNKKQKQNRKNTFAFTIYNSSNVKWQNRMFLIKISTLIKRNRFVSIIIFCFVFLNFFWCRSSEWNALNLHSDFSID